MRSLAAPLPASVLSRFVRSRVRVSGGDIRDAEAMKNAVDG
jgi:hypothetical protein